MAKLTLDLNKNKTADALRNSQIRATEQGFDHVNLTWFQQCLSYDHLGELLEQSASKTHDAVLHLEQVKPTLVDGRPEINIVGGKYDGSKWNLSDTSTNQFCNLLGLAPSFLSAGADHIENEYIEKVLHHRFEEKLKEKNKELFIRFRDGAIPTIRAFLTRRYCVIDHRWVLEQMKSFIPGGRISHFDQERFDLNEGDQCRYNVLIPDTIREEKDSGYGGGLNVGNSEIGTGRLNIRPMIFRHICYNGNIWNCEKGKAITQVHKGELNLMMLAAEIMVCIHSHIPLLSTNLDALLKLQGAEYATETNMLKLIAQLKNIKDLTLTYPQLAAVMEAYSQEAELGNNAFSFLNAITRAAHNGNVFGLEQQDMLETFAGNMTRQWIERPQRWQTYCRQAEEIDVAKVLKSLAA